MSARRRDTVTLLFTDIEGSTQLVRRLRGGYADVRAEHERLVRDAVAEHGGREIDTQGDSFFVSFRAAADAVRAAAAIQRALAAHEWPEGGEVRVRVGIHSGEPVESDGRYTGVAVNKAARIMALGRGGQVLLSQATRALLDEDDLEGLRLRAIGRHVLKDVPQPEQLFQLVIPGLAALPAPKTRRRGRVAAGAAIAVAAVVGGATAVFVGGDDAEPLALEPNHVGVIDAGSLQLLDSVPVGTRPRDVAVGEAAVWVANAGDRTVTRIDPAERRVVRSITLEFTPTSIAAGEGSVWIAGARGAVAVIDPDFDRVVATVNVRGPPEVTGIVPLEDVVAVGGGAAWVADGNGILSRIDKRSRRVVDRIDLGTDAAAITFGGGVVWVAATSINAVMRVDPKSGRVKAIPVDSGPADVAYGEGAAWLPASRGDAVSRVDADDDIETVVRVPGTPRSVAVGGGSVWVVTVSPPALVRIDPVQRRIAESIELGAVPSSIAFADGLLWVTTIVPVAGA